MQSIKLIVIPYKRELYFHEAMNSQILAKNKFSPIFLDLQYNMYMVYVLFIENLQQKSNKKLQLCI